jgi:hypothetical protein
MKAAAFAFAVSLLFALPVFAGFADDLARDLGPKTATLVAPAPTGGEWLIDLDATAGVQTGDLFAVIVKGAPIVHPTTKQTIGNLETVKAVVRVTKVKSGYSYVAPIGSADLKAGEEARRFSALPATFWDYTGEGASVLATLQGALPDLQWQSYAAAQAARPEAPRAVAGMEPGLLFVLNDKGLAVTDHAQQPLRFYRADVVSGKVQAAPPIAAPAAVPVGASIVTPGSSTQAPGTIPGGSGSNWMPKIFGGGSSTPPGPGGVLAGTGSANRGGLIVNQMDNREGVWYGPRMEGRPVGIESGDLTGDGKNEIALCFKKRLIISRVENGEFVKLAEYEFGRTGEALTLEGMDLDGNGRMELYITFADLTGVRSVGLELRDGKIEQITKPAPWFVRKVHLGAQGYALLGQELNPDLLNRNQDLSGPVFRVSLSGDRLERGAPVDLPSTLMLHGFIPFSYGGQGLLARIDMNDKLQIMTPDGGILWESNDYFGGTEISFERYDGNVGGTTRYAFVTPRLEPGPDGSIITPVNEGSRTFSAFRQFRGSHLKSVSFDGYSMVENWRTKPQGGYLADFRIADADNDGDLEIIMLVMFSRGDWLKAGYGNTALLIYEMQ